MAVLTIQIKRISQILNINIDYAFSSFFFQKIERIEMLDEAELLQQLMEHYCLTVAVKLTSDLG